MEENKTMKNEEETLGGEPVTEEDLQAKEATEDVRTEEPDEADPVNETQPDAGEGEAVGEDAADDETAQPEEDDADEAGKPLFGKKKKKDKKDEKIEELTDRVQRQMAEFDNYRKRTEKEKSQMFETGARSILEKLLPVVDNFERGLAAIDESQKDSSIASGMDMIYKQLTTMLEENGVRPILAEGEVFDPDYHNAVMHVEDDAYGENIVAEELQKGYMYKDAVLRYSMVKVAN